MALRFPYKDPNEVDKYTLDWSARLDTGETISTSTWSIVTASPTLVIDTETETTTTTTVTLSVGTEDEDYELLNRITTSGGRTLDQTVMIRIQSR